MPQNIFVNSGVEMNRIMSACSFASTSYAPAATSLVARIQVVASAATTTTTSSTPASSTTAKSAASRKRPEKSFPGLVALVLAVGLVHV
jgi:hypothetical protein